MKPLSLFLLFIGAFLSASAQQWTKLADLSENILTVYRSNGITNAGLQNGSLFLADSSDAWQPATNISGNVSSFFKTAELLYAAGYESVFKSTDHGQSWIKLATIYTFTDVSSVMVNENRMLAGLNGRGIWYSEDSGATWQEAVGSWQGPNTALIKHNNLLFTSYKGSGYLQYSDNNGTTWITPSGEGIKIQDSWQDINALASLRDSILIAGTGNFGLFTTYDGAFFSADNGDSWERKVSGLADSTITALATIKGIIFAGTEKKGVFYSNDLGASWHALNEGLGEIQVNDLYISGSTLYCASENGVYVTDLCLLLEDESEIVAVQCDVFTLNGQDYHESGFYHQMLTNQFGCDSLLNIDLTILHSTASEITEVACNTFQFHGVTYSESGEYAVVVTNKAGCDSTINLDLTIMELDTALIVTPDSITVSMAEATYQWVDCNNNFEVITNADGRSFFTEQPGDYAAVINNGSCSDTTRCVSFAEVVTGFGKGTAEALHIYPNPTAGRIIINEFSKRGYTQYQLKNYTGKVISHGKIEKKITTDIILPAQNGIYILELIGRDKVKQYRVIRE